MTRQPLIIVPHIINTHIKASPQLQESLATLRSVKRDAQQATEICGLSFHFSHANAGISQPSAPQALAVTTDSTCDLFTPPMVYRMTDTPIWKAFCEGAMFVVGDKEFISEIIHLVQEMVQDHAPLHAGLNVPEGSYYPATVTIVPAGLVLTTEYIAPLADTPDIAAPAQGLLRLAPFATTSAHTRLAAQAALREAAAQILSLDLFAHRAALA